MKPVPRPDGNRPFSFSSPSHETPYWIGPEEVRAALTPQKAVSALRGVLDAGFNPEHDAERSRVQTPGGTLMVMPSVLTLPEQGAIMGAKMLTLTPANAEAEAPEARPVIQGLYHLFGGPHQAPLAVLDGAALTAVRTPAVSALGVELLLDPARLAEARAALEQAQPSQGRGRRAHALGDVRLSLVLFGTGTQAWEHARTFADCFPLGRIAVVGRRLAKAEALAGRITEELGLQASALASGQDSPALERALADADVILTCTSSTSPLFPGHLVKDGCVVVAMGSHDPSARELDDALLSRAEVYVESRKSAVTEAGEIVQALESDAIVSQYSLTTLAEAVFYGRRSFERPAVFKTTGMPWQDLALAAACLAG